MSFGYSTDGAVCSTFELQVNNLPVRCGTLSNAADAGFPTMQGMETIFCVREKDLVKGPIFVTLINTTTVGVTETDVTLMTCDPTATSAYITLFKICDTCGDCACPPVRR